MKTTTEYTIHGVDGDMMYGPHRFGIPMTYKSKDEAIRKAKEIYDNLDEYDVPKDTCIVVDEDTFDERGLCISSREICSSLRLPREEIVSGDYDRCCFCRTPIKRGLGNDPWPLRHDEESVCCDRCNNTKVVPARLARLSKLRKRESRMGDIDLFLSEHRDSPVSEIIRGLKREFGLDENAAFELLNGYKAPCRVTESNRIYKYTLRLTQPEGSNYHLTNQDKLKFKTEAEANEMRDRIFANNKSSFEKKGLGLEVVEIQDKPRRTQQKPADFQNPFKEGDILFGDIGYSMSIPVWVQVRRVTPSRVYCRELKSSVDSHDGYGQAGTKMPVKDSFLDRGGAFGDEELLMTVKKYGTTGDPRKDYSAWLNYGNGYIFHLWDGKPKSYDYND